MLRDLARDLVALEHVLERADLEAELVGDGGSASGSRPRGSSARGPGPCRRGCRAASRAAGRGAAATGLSALAGSAFSFALVLLPLAPCRPARRWKRLAEHHLDAHARAPGSAARPGTRKFERLGFSPSANLMPRGASLKTQLLGRLAPAHLEDRVLAADRVARAVQHVDRGDAARELAVDVDVVVVDHVARRAPRP